MRKHDNVVVLKGVKSAKYIDGAGGDPKDLLNAVNMFEIKQ